MKNPNLNQKVDNLPQTPGTYIFKDSNGKIIYVGKAKNLRSRVKSYFSISIPSDFKTSELIKMINDLEFIKVESEFEAVILEAELIKKYRPKYNIVLKDDRTKIYIVIRDEKVSISGKSISLQKVITARKPDLLKSDVIFGPYPNSMVVKNILGTIRKIYPFRDCSLSKFTKYKKIGSPCLYGHINICPSPCIKFSHEDIIRYKKNINGVKKILSGEVSKLISNIQKEMEKSSINLEYENAAELRNLLQKFYYVQKTFREASEYMDNPYLIDDISKKSMRDIREFLPFLNKLPRRIECYDISNVSGKEAVGSMIVGAEGRIEKSEYKRFKVKIKETPDDFGMMYEVLHRRLIREKPNKNEKSWGLPDLIIVDGGKPQVTAAHEVMNDLKIKIPLVGIAKRNETLIFKNNNDFTELDISKDNLGMKLILSLRDESHRFAQSYHHLLRKRTLQK